jgi:spore coat protein X
MSTRWSALDDCKKDHTTQDAVQLTETLQASEELIVIKDSCNIEVKTTETQVAVSLQAAIQVAIALVINLTIADSNQNSVIKQANKQKLIIENSRDVKVTTTDTDVAISLQVLIQILLALIVQIDIL